MISHAIRLDSTRLDSTHKEGSTRRERSSDVRPSPKTLSVGLEWAAVLYHQEEKCRRGTNFHVKRNEGLTKKGSTPGPSIYQTATHKESRESHCLLDLDLKSGKETWLINLFIV